ncbi:MAG: hypothetical protein WCJ18_06840 [Planctomycetota bacterium]
MADSITCICGYRGQSVAENGRTVCPICRTPARTEAMVLANADFPSPLAHDSPSNHSTPRARQSRLGQGVAFRATER